MYGKYRNFLCFCGSGKKFKDCCLLRLRDAGSKLAPVHLAEMAALGRPCGRRKAHDPEPSLPAIATGIRLAAPKLEEENESKRTESRREE